MAKKYQLQPYRLSAALFVAMAMPVAGSAFAQDSNTQADQQSTTDQQTTSDSAQTDQTSTDKKTTTLQKVVITGSLIPQTEIETNTPLTIITAEDLQTRGFTSVADALQQSSFATGGVQGNQTSASFTQGAETLSLFGLDPSYVKYLIDGRPMANYPALYNGSQIFNNISGIPIDLVDRIEILPGGQSSLYGSDAIAGVVNIILKKHIDGGIVNARLGGYDDGGGFSRRLSIADSFENKDGRFRVLLGAQYEKTDPVWGYQRDLTKHFNTNAYNGADPLVSRDWLVYSPFTSYHFEDLPGNVNCNGLAAAFGGTVQQQTRPGFGQEHYCGSFNTPGYRTLKNGKEATQLYTHATFDISPNTQLYADVLYNRETVKYHIGSNYTWWGTGVEWGYFFDPRVGSGIADAYATYFCGSSPSPACLASLPAGDLLNLQRAFAPEDMGNWERSMDRNKSTSYAVTFGVNGTFGDSSWDYDLNATRTQYKLDEDSFARLAGPINDYFQTHVLGPQLGLDPYFGAYPVFEPDYAAFYTTMSAADFASFTGRTNSRSKTYDNMIRAQVTNGSLFSLPGGDAGLAVAVEGGSQGWDYQPDPLLLNGGIWGTTAVSGNGSRSRYAVTAETRLPVLDSLTLTASGRYDNYHVSNDNISKPTYSAGLEFRPFRSLLLRAKYGTAFKAPTLADQFQGISGFYSFTTDYYNCGLLGYDPAHVDDCPAVYSNTQYFGQQSGNPNLEPINATVWSYGAVWAPTATFSLSADYYHFDISNEVSTQSVDQLMRDEYNCRNGNLDPSSPTCQAAFDQITRGATGRVQSIFVEKVNVANELLNAVTVSSNYLQDLGSWGGLRVAATYTRNLKHDYQQYPGDPILDALNDPYYSSDPKWKGNASLSWSKNNWTTTLYGNIIGPTPNYRAQLSQSDGYDYPGAAKLPTYTLFNLSVNYNPTEDLQLSFLVDNLANKHPDMDHTYPGSSGAPYNSSNFSPYGRGYYLEARWNFGKDGN